MLPLSHDEVVHGKGALISRMPGDEWQQFANLRLMYTYMFTHPGTQLLFMGGEFGQTSEWKLEEGPKWHLTQYDFHKGVQRLITDLNNLYRQHTAFYEQQFSPEGFEWIDHGDYQNSLLSYLRKGKEERDVKLVICNFTPVFRGNQRVGVPFAGKWKEILNSDAKKYNGSNQVNTRQIKSDKIEWNGREKK